MGKVGSTEIITTNKYLNSASSDLIVILDGVEYLSGTYRHDQMYSNLLRKALPRKFGRTNLNAHSIEYIYQHFPEFNLRFHNTILGISSRLWTLVPRALYNAGNDNLHFKHIGQLSEQSEIRKDYIAPIDAYLLYEVDASFIDDLGKIHNPKFCHVQSALIHYFQSSANQSSDMDNLYIYVSKDQISIHLFKNSKLIISNRYFAPSHTDKLYYTMLMIEEFDLDQQGVEVNLSGLVNTSDDYYIQLAKFILKLKIQLTESDSIPASERTLDHEFLLIKAAHLFPHD